MDPIVPISPLTPSATVGSELGDKLQQTQAAGLQKRAQLNGVTPKDQLLAEFHTAAQSMTDAELRTYFGPEAADSMRAQKDAQRQIEDTALRQRTGTELAGDIPLAMGRTAVSLVGGLGQLALDHVPAAQALESGQFGEGGKHLMDTVDKVVSGGLSKVDQLLARHTSDVAQANAALVAQQDNLSQVQHKAEYDTALANGDNPVLAGAVRVGKDLVSGAVHTAQNPTELADMAVGQVPTLGIGVAAKGAITVDAVAARAALLRESSLLTAAKTGTAIPAREALLAEARQQLATRNLQLGVGATEAGGAYQQTFAAELDRQRAAGVPEDRLDVEAARQAATTAAAIQGPIAAVTGKLAADFELDPVGSHLVKEAFDGTQTVGQTLAHAAADIGKEGLEETIQSGTGQLAQNLGERTVNPEQDLLDGVGTAAGQAGIAAVGMAAPLHAPGTLAAAAADLTVGAGKSIHDLARARIARAQEALAAPSAEHRRNAGSQMQAATASLDAGLRATPATADSAPLAPVADEPLLTPELKQALAGDTPGMSKLAALGRATAAALDPETSKETRDGLAFFSLKTARELRDSLSRIQEAHDAAATPEEQAQYAALGEQIHGVVNAPYLRHLEQQVSHLDDATLQGVFDQLPDSLPEDMPIEPATQAALEKIRELSYTAPDRLPAEIAEKAVVLFQHSGTPLTDADRVQLDLAQGLAKLQETHTAALAQLPTPSGKRSTAVAQEIRETGFDTGTKRLNAITDHVRAVVQAMAAGEPAVAQSALAAFGKFAQHMAGKAASFDDAMTQLVTQDGDRTEVPYQTLDADGQLSKARPAFLERHNAGSHALIDSIFADAAAVTGAYNALTTAYPALVGKKVPQTVTAPATPAWKSALPGRAAAVDGPSAAPATAPAAPATPTPTSTTSPAPVPEAATPAPVRADAADASAPESAPAGDQAAATPAAASASESLPGSKTAEASAAPAQEPVKPAVDTPALAVDFGNPARAPASELAQATSLTDPEYLAAVNPTGKVTPVPDDATIDAELDDSEPSSRAVPVGQVGDVSLHADGDYLYAVRGEQTVGLLVHKGEGSTLLVRSTERGNGIGKALMRELLVRKPLAQSNGLSPAAQATRLSVLRELRAEHAARSAASAEEPAASAHATSLPARFPGLMENVGPGLAGQNQLLKAFQPASRGNALFTRFAQPVQALTNALARGLEGLRALLPEGQRAFLANEQQLNALQALITVALPNLVGQLNQNLQDAAHGRGRTFAGTARSNKGFMRTLLADPATKWSYHEYKSLHATQWTAEGAIQYQPEIAQGMALAGLDWVMQLINNPVRFDREEILREFPEISDEALALFETSHFFTQPLRSLAAHLTEVLGLRSNPDAPISQSDGIAKALAADIVAALRDLNVLRVHTAKYGEHKTLTFLEFNRDVQGLKPLRDQLGSGTLLTRLLAPDSHTVPSIGSAPAGVASRVTGTNQELSREQQQTLRVQQDTGFTRNVPFVDVLTKLGPTAVARFLGYTFGELGGLNQEHARKVSGKNAGVQYVLDSLNEVLGLQEQYAAATDGDSAAVPVHYRYGIDSNGRMRAEGFGPQSDKLAREVLTPGAVTVQLTDPNQVANFFLRVAQALGVKTEQKPNALAVQEVLAKLAEPAHQALVQDLRTLATGEASDALGGQIVDQLQALGYDSVRALHALSAVAAFAEADGETFTHRLAFELDGKTDGPINALIQFGLHALDGPMLQQLRQGGIFVNDVAKPTLNAHGSDLGDLYGNAAGQAQQRVTREWRNADRPTREVILAGLRQLGALGFVESQQTDTGTTITIKRGAAKHGVMATDYGSGEKAIVTELAQAMVDQLYVQLSEALSHDGVLPDSVIEQIETLMGRYFNRSTGKWTDVRQTLPNLRQNTGYATLKFSKQHVDNLVDNLRRTVGGWLVQGIQSDMAPVLNSFQLLYQSTALQTFALRRAFQAQVAAKRAELIAAGTLLPNDSLSRNQEQTILQGLQHLMPVYALRQTEAGNRNQGIAIAQRDTSAQFQLNGKPVTATSITGGFGLDLDVTDFELPGVRAAALLNIGLGDATMMGQMFVREPRGLVNVYDGLEVHDEDLKAIAHEVNGAVAQGYQYTGLQAVADSFASFELELADLEPTELFALADALRLDDREDLSVDDVRAALQDLIDDLKAELPARAARTAAVQQAIFELPVAIDHMSGGENAWTNESEGAPKTPVADAAAWIQERAEQILAEREARTPDTSTDTVGRVPGEHDDPALFERLGLADGRLATLDASELNLLLDAYPHSSPLHRFLAGTLLKLLPERLRMYVGTPAQLRSKQQELFPGQDFLPETTAGAYWQDTLFLSHAKMETLLHELVHATTYAAVQRFYSRGKGLSAHQKDAVRSLEILAGEFLGLDPRHLSPSARQALTLAQDAVRTHRDGGNPAAMVEEFLAWSLTNPALANALRQTRGSSALKTLAQTVLRLVRKILGLPANPTVESFLEQTLGQFHRLVRRPLPVQDTSPVALFQALASSRPAGTKQEQRLQALAQSLNTVLQVLPATGTPAAGQANARITAFSQAVQATERFLDAGFPLSDSERYLFELTQATLASGIHLDSATLHTFQEIYDAAMPQLKPEDFLDNPADTSELAFNLAHKRFDALTQVRYTDAANRSNLLANFVALALVYEPLRAKLDQMQLPASKVDRSSLDALLKSAASLTLDKLEHVTLRITPTSSLSGILDTLALRLGQTQEAAVARLSALNADTWVDQLETWTKQGLGRLWALAETAHTRRLSAGEVGGINGWINGLLQGVHALTDDTAASAFAESALSLTNESKLPKAIRDLIAEIVGTVGSNEAVAQLLNRSKHLVSRARQRLRDEVPAKVRKFFKTPLTPAEWASLHRAVGKTDLQALLGNTSATQLLAVVANPAANATAIAQHEQRLGQLSPQHLQAWTDGAQALGTFLVRGTNGHELLARNASALARRAGQGVLVDEKTAQQAAPVLDRLVTLQALSALPQGEREMLARLLRDEREGMHQLLHLQRTLVQNERSKPDADRQRFNRWKGYTPESWDPRRDVVLAGAQTGAELLKRGYRYIGAYLGDASDPLAGLGYYVTTLAGGEGTYNQGAMQTIEGTVAGVDRLSGRTLDRRVKTLIDEPRTVAAITRAKQRALASGRPQRGSTNLLPVFDNDGHITGYERVLDPAVLDTHLRGKKDFAQALGMWMGRQAEEQLARELNAQLVGVLKANWDNGIKDNREKEYIDIAHAQDKTVREAWDAIPRETQKMLKETFGSHVMVRRDMVNNAIGYRSASVGNIFTGMTDLDPKVREALQTAAYAVAGKHAKHVYTVLTQSEKFWQGLVGHSKEWIVVRSGVVVVANALSNQFQLLQMGVPRTKLISMQAAKVREAEQYLRNERRMAQIAVEKAATGSPARRAQLEREGQMLADANTRLSIWPLIVAGELPAIAEGLTEQDEYSLLHDGMQWVNDRLDSLPPAATTALRYASISKDTALYQGLNRMIQFGDFMAKATLYEHLVATGSTQEEALRKVSESFVNYNLKAGRTRDYLENMGVVWFYNYKLRIQKIVLRTLRENPLHFLLGGVGGTALGQDSLLSSGAPAINWTYGFGLGQFWRAHNMVLWNQLFD